jgi:ribose transport system permease protein
VEATVGKEKGGLRINFQYVYKFSRVFVLLLIIFAVALMSDVFFTPSNGINVLRQASLTVLLALGETIVILTAGIDLSIGAVLTLAGIATASVLKAGLPMPLGILAGVGLGSLAGLVNGLMVAVIGLPPFVATYGTMWIAAGFAVVLMRGYIIYGFEPAFRFLGIGKILGIPTPIIIMAVFWAATWFLLSRTTFGRSIFAVGANREAARLSGINIKKTLISAYTLSGFFAGLAGVVFTARLNAAEAGLGEQMLLPTIAGVCIGGTSLMGGEGGIGGTVIGVVIMTIIANAMNLLGISSIWQSPVQGVVIVVAVLLDQWGRRATARQQAGG